MEEPFGGPGGHPGVRGVLHRPEYSERRPDAFVLTHGAGSNCHAPLLVRLARAFADAGYLVLRYDLPFRQQHAKRPPAPVRAARDREGIAAAIEAVRPMAARVFAGGHSYGGRQTAMLAAEKPGVAAALLLLSYPLHAPDRPERRRTAFFPEWRVPALFVHGTADPFASIEELRDAISIVPARTEILPVEGAGHDLARAADLSAEILTRFHALIG